MVLGFQKDRKNEQTPFAVTKHLFAKKEIQLF